MAYKVSYQTYDYYASEYECSYVYSTVQCNILSYLYFSNQVALV